MTATMTGPAPRYATEVDGRSTADRVAKLSRAFGRPFMPWQGGVGPVERTPPGRPPGAFPFAVVTVPRQAGKTTWLLGKPWNAA
jgi:hypothetical protein